MSHYLTIVVGCDPDGDMYVNGPDYPTDEYDYLYENDIEAMKKVYEVDTAEECLQFVGDWCAGEDPELVRNGDEVYIVYRMTNNPYAMWDWYSEGGRWEGWLINKDYEEVNNLTVGELLDNAMLTRGIIQGLVFYDEFKTRIENAVAKHNDLPPFEAIRTDSMLRYIRKVVGLKYPTDIEYEFVNYGLENASTPYYLVIDGTFFTLEDDSVNSELNTLAKDYGVEIGETDAETFENLLRSFGPDTQLTVIDLHM